MMTGIPIQYRTKDYQNTIYKNAHLHKSEAVRKLKLIFHKNNLKTAVIC